MDLFGIDDIGALICWLFKGCKTKFSDEISSITNRKYILRNHVVGALTILIIISIVISILYFR